MFSYYFFQPEGKGKYVFDIGCQQHGEYIPLEMVRTFSQFTPFFAIQIHVVLHPPHHILVICSSIRVL